MKALHMSKTASAATTNVLKPLVRKDGTFDLVDTRKHNVVEHDASFTRLDFHEGDNYTFQPYMLQAMLDDADGQTVTLRSLARTFIRRRKESKAAGAPSLSISLWFVSVLQKITVRNACQLGDLSKEMMEAVFAEERFLDAVLQNTKPRTLFTLLGNAVDMMYWVIIGPGKGDKKNKQG